MTKVMLVEDDKSLREIYGVRLLAEGYDIVSASDGEEALAMAIKERPTLIISDVMMPKISGFDMLDILRSTTETRDIKVIMMTALSSEDQRLRGQSLGADRYLVKSQVGIEDVVRVVHEVLGDQPAAPAAAPQPVQAFHPAPPPYPAPQAPLPPQQQPVGPMQPTAAPVFATVQPTPPQQQPYAAPPQPMPAPAAPQQPPQQPAPGRGLVFQTPAPAQAQIQAPVGQVAGQPAPPQQVSQPRPMYGAPAPAAQKSPASRNRIIQPLGDPTIAPVNINELLDKELAREAGINEESRPEVATVDQEKQMVDDQIQQFQNAPVPPTPPLPEADGAALSPPMPPVTIDDQGTLSNPPSSQTDEIEPPAAPPVQPPAPIV